MTLRREFDRHWRDFPAGTPLWHDSSFQTFLASNPQWGALDTFLPRDLNTVVFQSQEQIQTLSSSYQDHGYGFLFYALTQVLKPKLCVEIGVLGGFSLLTVAAALRDNGAGQIQGFDLFEDYPYRHDKEASVRERIQDYGLGNWASVARADASAVAGMFDQVDYLHVDISNNGQTYRDVFEQWTGKVQQLIVLEGGSGPRDHVPWMTKYGFPPIAEALAELRSQYPNWLTFVLEPYPSLTVAVPTGAMHRGNG